MTHYELIRRTRLLLMLSLCSFLPHTMVHAQQPRAASKGCELINADKQNMALKTHKNLRNVDWAEVIL